MSTARTLWVAHKAAVELAVQRAFQEFRLIQNNMQRWHAIKAEGIDPAFSALSPYMSLSTNDRTQLEYVTGCMVGANMDANREEVLYWVGNYMALLSDAITREERAA